MLDEEKNDEILSEVSDTSSHDESEEEMELEA